MIGGFGQYLLYQPRHINSGEVGRCAPILRAPPQRWGAGDHGPYSVRVAQCRPQGGQSAKALTSNNDGIVRYGMARRLCLPLCVFHGGTGK